MAADRQQCRIQTLAFSVLILGLSEALITQTSAKRLLAFPLPYGHSHLMGLKKQAEEIADRGHEVMVSFKTYILSLASCIYNPHYSIFLLLKACYCGRHI